MDGHAFLERATLVNHVLDILAWAINSYVQGETISMDGCPCLKGHTDQTMEARGAPILINKGRTHANFGK